MAKRSLVSYQKYGPLPLDGAGGRARRYYSITAAGRQSLTTFRADWAWFSATVGAC